MLLKYTHFLGYCYTIAIENKNTSNIVQLSLNVIYQHNCCIKHAKKFNIGRSKIVAVLK